MVFVNMADYYPTYAILPYNLIGYGEYVYVGFISFINNENIDDLPLAT